MHLYGNGHRLVVSNTQMDDHENGSDGGLIKRTIGPGLIVAVTGVGAGDLVAGLVAGSRYGLTFIWAVLAGIVVKFTLAEGLGRFHLSTDKTILDGIHSLGRWASGFFGIYALIFGIIYGAAVVATCSLAANALLPSIPFWVYLLAHPIVGALLVLGNRYETFENIMSYFVIVMFITIIGSAVLVIPQLPGIISGAIPLLPEGSVVYALGLIGGTGGTISVASYGYWLEEKGWDTSDRIPTMRIDAATAYILTGIFVIALLVLTTALIYGTDLSVSGKEGLIVLASQLGNELNPVFRPIFLIGFWSAAFTSLLGSWHGISYLFADFAHDFSSERSDTLGAEALRQTKSYKFYVLWMTFPAQLVHIFGKPVFIVIIYAALGAIFLPYLAIILLVLLNSQQVGEAERNNRGFNVLLGLSSLLFIVLFIIQIVNLIPSLSL
jgi:Mn2+/Fe2+ NRAMP family transporter